MKIVSGLFYFLNQIWPVAARMISVPQCFQVAPTEGKFTANSGLDPPGAFVT
jgi:hypothetical protein